MYEDGGRLPIQPICDAGLCKELETLGSKMLRLPQVSIVGVGGGDNRGGGSFKGFQNLILHR
jgi:hypothetical protein